jgi:hypothetical protein
MSPACHCLALPIAALLAGIFQFTIASAATVQRGIVQQTGAQPGDAVTYHYDNLRTGWNQNETMLTAASVGGASFGLLSQTALDEQVDAQPLFLGGQTIIGQGTHDVVYVATENNTVYAIDAESGKILLSNNLGAAVPISALPGYCNNNSNNIGINSTPVIDRTAGLLYVVADTYVHQQAAFYVHALNLATLQDAMTPVLVTAQSTYKNGKPAQFTAANSRQRPGLLETAGNIYAGFGSFCDFNANVSRGWVLGWNAATLAPLPVSVLNNRRPSAPDDFFLSSVWMSGYGIASDDNGSLFLITGNSDYSGTTWNGTYNLAESVLKLSTDLTTVESFYTPNNPNFGWRVLDQQDNDFGAAGVLLLPPQPGAIPNLAVAAGKAGPTYLLNRDDLGGLGEPRKTLGTVVNNGCWCGQSYFVGADGNPRVLTSTGGALRSYLVKTAPKPALAEERIWSGLNSAQDPGFFTTVSSNGTQAGSAVVWAVIRPSNDDPAYVTLYAFDPTNQSGPIWSGVAGTWPFAVNANANLVPVVGNGHVFVASYANLSIFGLSAAARPISFRAPPRPPMPAFPDAPHALAGLVVAHDGAAVTLRLRSGTAVKVDIAAALAAHHVAPPAIGHAVLARGDYGKDGVFAATYLLHQKDSQALWPADR